MERSRIVSQNYVRLIFSSMVVALVSALLAFALKHSTEIVEHYLLTSIRGRFSFLFIIVPSVGITAIYFLRKYVFRNRKNKGITEIYKTLDQRKDHLPLFKIPSHFFNGFLTVIFGGSTGVEVSTVVAAATIGNHAYEREFSARMYKRELICAGVVAGVAVLFTSPVAGWLFALEVIARKTRNSLFTACTTSALISWIFIFFFDSERILPQHVTDWSIAALPFFFMISILGGTLSVYFTLLVIHIKKAFSRINNNFMRVNLGALSVGTLIYFFPALYGDSYQGLRDVLQQPLLLPATGVLIITVALLKPLAASLTLGAGSDGGVFAPSIVAGAFLGLVFAHVSNLYLGTSLLPLNFALAGAAATLAASLSAPLTAAVLVCNLLPNGYALFLPLLVSCFIAVYFAKSLLPYNVYTHDAYLNSRIPE